MEGSQSCSGACWRTGNASAVIPIYVEYWTVVLNLELSKWVTRTV